MTSSNADLSNTLAAVFATQRDARDAIKDLHKAGFRKTWLGTTAPPEGDAGEPTVEEPGNIGRFLSLEGRKPLRTALLEHGVSEMQASDIEGDVAAGMSILTVYGEDNPDRVRTVVTEHKGHVIGAVGATPTAVSIASADPRTGVPRDEERAVAGDAAFTGRPYDDELGDDYPSEVFIERRTQAGGWR